MVLNRHQHLLELESFYIERGTAIYKDMSTSAVQHPNTGRFLLQLDEETLNTASNTYHIGTTGPVSSTVGVLFGRRLAADSWGGQE